MSPWSQLLWNPPEMDAVVERLHVSSRHADTECSCTSTTNFALQRKHLRWGSRLLVSWRCWAFDVFSGLKSRGCGCYVTSTSIVGSHSPSPFGGKFDSYFHAVKSGESLLQFSRNLCAAGDLRTCLISWLHHGRSMKLDCQRYLDIVPTSRPN